MRKPSWLTTDAAATALAGALLMLPGCATVVDTVVDACIPAEQPQAAGPTTAQHAGSTTAADTFKE